MTVIYFGFVFGRRCPSSLSDAHHQGLATPVDVKLKLLGVLENMRQDAQTASAVRATCLALLPTYPSQQFVTATLRVLTRLAASSVTDIPHQVRRAQSTRPVVAQLNALYFSFFSHMFFFFFFLAQETFDNFIKDCFL